MDKQAIETLRRLNQAQLEELYHRHFTSPDGAVVLEDLKARFFEYVPVSDMNQAGAQAVLLHIKNMVEPMPKDDNETNNA